MMAIRMIMIVIIGMGIMMRMETGEKIEFKIRKELKFRTWLEIVKKIRMVRYVVME